MTNTMNTNTTNKNTTINDCLTNNNSSTNTLWVGCYLKRMAQLKSITK